MADNLSETTDTPTVQVASGFHLGSCTEVLKGFANSCIDMTLFSPPYDAIRDYNGFEIDLGELGRQLLRVTKDGGVCCCVINDGTSDFKKSLTTARMTVSWADMGWGLFETVIYSRHGRPGAWWGQRFRVDHEYILIFFKGKRPKSFDKKHLMVPSKYADESWHGTDRQSDGSLRVVTPRPVNPMKCRGTVWQYSASNTESNPLKMKHPATYPDLLAEDLIRCFSVEGDVVLDPTCGSGTTCVEAKKWGRQWVGIDVSAEYLDIARARLALEVTDSIL
jgi:DNA modification methylase